MILNPAVLEKLDECKSFDEFVQRLVTGAGVRAAAENQFNEFFIHHVDGEKIYNQFAEELEATGAVSEIRQEVQAQAEDGSIDEKLVTLRLVNEAIYHECLELYREAKNQITSQNEMKTLAEIVEAKGQERGGPGGRE